MRILKIMTVVAGAALLSGCVGGFMWPSSNGEDKVTVAVDGVNPQQMQAMADEQCAKHDGQHARLTSSQADRNGGRHDKYECVKK